MTEVISENDVFCRPHSAEAWSLRLCISQTRLWCSCSSLWPWCLVLWMFSTEELLYATESDCGMLYWISFVFSTLRDRLLVLHQSVSRFSPSPTLVKELDAVWTKHLVGPVLEMQMFLPVLPAFSNSGKGMVVSRIRCWETMLLNAELKRMNSMSVFFL